MPKAFLNISALCAEFCTNIVCPSCGLASAMSWLHHCCWRLECSSCQRGEKKNSLVVKSEVITWSVKGLTKAGRHCERGKSVVGVAGPLKTGRSKHFSVRVSIKSGYCADVTLGLYEELSSSEQSFLCLTCCQPSRLLRGKVDALRFGLPQLKA